ncbi:hypothetical protein H1R20_g9035, partial [Candolleomyces eurysporus]
MWVVADDQSINVVESPEFRELLLFLGDGKLEDRDIPHRDKMTSMILDAHALEYQKMRKDLKNALGRISFTMDLWTDPNLTPFMAVTAHYYARKPDEGIAYRSGLVAFHYTPGGHSGDELSQHFFKIMDDLDVLHKIGSLTMDNASNNNTLMAAIELKLQELDIPFSADGNRIRCFPHVVNLACGAIIQELKKLATEKATNYEFDYIIDQPDWHLYLDALESDLIARVRALVAACRKSSQRRQDLQKIIREGNNKGLWAGKIRNPFPKDDPNVLRPLQLLRDCETRWSSIYLMITRFLYLYPAIQMFLLERSQSDLRDCLLDEHEISVLEDIHQVLHVAHLVQELLSGERTPTLSIALPTYELLISKWKDLKRTIPELAPFIGQGIRKIEEYMAETRKSRIYAHAMDEQKAAKKARDDAEDISIVERELLMWETDSLLTVPSFGDLTSFWAQWIYYQLKHLRDLVAQELDYTLEGGVTDAAFSELYDGGKFKELEELLANLEVSSS